MINRSVFQVVGVLALISISLSSCFEEPPSPKEILDANIKLVDKTQLAADIVIIDDSLAKWSITPLTEPNGVRYTIESLGTGKKPKLTSQIAIKYNGKLLTTKSVFDQSEGVYVQLSRLIIGWQTVLPLLPEGTKATLYVPSGFAYGPNEIKDQDQSVLIPANSNLIFEIELLDVL